MKDPIISIDLDYSGREFQELVCVGCGTVGNAIEGDWSDDVNDRSLVPGSDGILICQCGSHTFFASKRTVSNTKETPR